MRQDLLILPRPRLVSVTALVEGLERMRAKERRAEFPQFDRKLRKAVSEDMAAYVGEVMSSVAFRGGRGGAHSIRGKDGGDAKSRQLRVVSACEYANAEAAARILVARRCKQAGMHWRHHNAACVCALIAKIRSAA